VCKIIFESKADTTFRKGKVKQTTWVGCEHRGCKYWGHALCVGLGIKPKVWWAISLLNASSIEKDDDTHCFNVGVC